MDAVTASRSTPPSRNADAASASCDDPLRSPDRPRSALVAKRRIMRAGAVGSPVRRSPRLSCLPPPRLPIERQDTQDPNESTSDESESVNDVALQLSREETPENDDLLDEPSTVLASKIIRAHDNPSPPPQDLACPGVNLFPGKDSRFPPTSVSPPPSPFRPINLLERLDQLSQPSTDASHSLGKPTLGDQAELPEPSVAPLRPLDSARFFLPSVTSAPMKGVLHEDLASVDTIPSSSTHCTIDDLPSPPSRRACQLDVLSDDVGDDPSTLSVAGLYGKLVTMTSCVDSRALTPSPTRAVDPPLDSVVPSAVDVQTMVSAQLETGEDIVPTGNDSVSKGDRESKSGATGNEVDLGPHQRLDSTTVLADLCLPSGPVSSVEETSVPVEPTGANEPLGTPLRTPKPFIMHPDYRSIVQRPVVPTPVRANNGARKLNSPLKLSSGVGDIHRTPAQRVPIEFAAARGTASFKKTPSIGLDKHESGRLTIRAPVFTRPALGDPSRSPAKRVPVSDLITSPTRVNPAQCSPARVGLRARSASTEPHPVGPVTARSRSVEPSASISKSDDLGKIKESIFQMVPTVSRPATKLPFPILAGDLPPPIPEEHQNEVQNVESTVAQSSTKSQLRLPSTNSRIPRIGNKPYARPLPKGGKATSTTTNKTSVSSLFRTTSKNEAGKSNTDIDSTQPANDQRLIGSLKRKRGAEAKAAASSGPVMIRRVVPGMLSGNYVPNPMKTPSRIQAPSETSPVKAPQPLKFRKVVDGMLSARYAPAKTNFTQTGSSDSPLTLSPLSELSSSSDEDISDQRLVSIAHPPTRPNGETSHTLRANEDISNQRLVSIARPPARPNSETSHTPRTNDISIVEPTTQGHSLRSLHQSADSEEPASRPRRTSRTRKAAQQQYVLDVFNDNSATRPPPARRKPQTRTEGDGFVGMSATALKTLTTSNTTKNQQTVAILATEVIRKDGLRPESPAVKARTILQKQRDERDRRRRERAQRRDRTSEEGLGGSDTEGQTELSDLVSLGARADHDENEYTIPQKHRRGPGEEEDYETPERPERIIGPLRIDVGSGNIKPTKQVKWHRGLSTAAYLEEVDSNPKSLPKDVIMRSCLAPTSKNLPLDPLGNLVDIESRATPELVTEQIVVKKYIYDDDVEPEPIPAKTTRSKSRKNKS